MDDAAGAEQVLGLVESDAFPRLGVIWADGKYHSYNLYAWIEENADYRLHIVSRPAAAKGFVLLPKRWGRRTNLGLAGSLASAEQGL